VSPECKELGIVSPECRAGYAAAAASRIICFAANIANFGAPLMDRQQTRNKRDASVGILRLGRAFFWLGIFDEGVYLANIAFRHFSVNIGAVVGNAVIIAAGLAAIAVSKWLKVLEMRAARLEKRSPGIDRLV
jgi:hypothetical protein